MKKIKNSITLIVALATIGVTLMSNKAITGKKNNLESLRCFKGPVTFKLFCSSSPETISSTTSCDYAEAFEFYKAHVWDMNPDDYITDDLIVAECSGGDVFCCAQIFPDEYWTGGNFEGPCPGQPYYNLEGTYAQYEVWQVHCKYN
ncbi:hypothetical protein [Pedobacter ginsengisoli]|uniref:hypothetical protein n=1 Tax=Pedobacter ginsengisoli TaxID=363852 RepID=UPI00254E6E1A|nr:hypothetical protein [Pedobacter ginsengisoli]